MITEVLVALLGGLSAILILQTAVIAIRMYVDHKKYQKELKGLPLLPLSWFPGGALHELIFKSYASMKYEPIFRKYGSKTFGGYLGLARSVSTIDLELIRSINITESNKHINRPKNYALPVRELEQDNIALSSNDQWRRIRRSIAPSFTKNRVQSKNVILEMDAVIEHLIDALESRIALFDKECQAGQTTKKSAEIDATDLMLRYSTDLVFSCFYKQYNIIDYNSEREFYSAQFEDGLNAIEHPLIEISMVIPILKTFLNWFITHFHKFGEMKLLIMGFVKDQTVLNMQARREMAAAKKAGKTFDPENFKLSDGRVFKSNMIDGFIDSYHEGKVTKTEYMHSSFFLINAGIRTVADALAQLLYFLASNQRVQEKLRNSIKKDGIESEYLGWCINETLRVGTPVPFGSTRMAEQDFEVEGGVVPKGTIVHTPTQVIHRLPEYWGEDANQFRPERWADADKFHPAQFMPFGGGLRVCPGREFAMYDLRKVTQALLSRYKIERCPKTSDSPLYHSPLMLFLKREIPIYVGISRLNN